MRWLDDIIIIMHMNLSKLQKKTKEPDILQSMGSERVRHDLATEQ